MISKKYHGKIKMVIFLLIALAVLTGAPLLKENFLYLSFIILIFIFNDISIQKKEGDLRIPVGFPILFLSLVFEDLRIFLLLSAVWIGVGIFKQQYKHEWKGLPFLVLSWISAATLLGYGYTVAERQLALGSYYYLIPLMLALFLAVSFRKLFLDLVVFKGFLPRGFRSPGPSWKKALLFELSLAAVLNLCLYYVFLLIGWHAVPVLIGLYLIAEKIFYFTNMQRKKIQELQRKASEYSGVAEALAGAIEARDSTEFSHLKRIKYFAVKLGAVLNLPADEIEAIELAAVLHDVGKIAVPGYILSKPGRLNSGEYQRMIRHPQVAVRILGDVDFSSPVISAIKYHHENYDGSGYPEGLKGEQIPLGARILSVVDCYDILTKTRPYRKGWPHEEALEMINREAGRKFDPAVVGQFNMYIQKWLSEVRKKVDPLCPKENLLYTEEDKATPQACHESQLMGESASSYKDIYALYELAETMKNSMNLKKSLTILCNKISRVIPFSCCVIYFFHSEDKTLRPVYVTGADQQVINPMMIKIGEKLTGWVASNKISIKMSGICSDFDSIKCVSEGKLKEFRSALASPLLIDETLIGVISLYETKEDEYTEESLKLLDMISRQVAHTVYNSLMSEEDRNDSLTDSLTGLPNVRYLFDILDYELKKAKRHGRNLALLGMDLDGLKTINEAFGMAMGDKVLIHAADSFKKVLREYDTCVRYAGDEFYVVLPGINRENAGKIMERIQECIAAIEINPSQGTEQRISVTIGASFFPDDGLDIETLISAAHSRLYREKQAKIRMKTRTAVEKQELSQSV